MAAVVEVIDPVLLEGSEVANGATTPASHTSISSVPSTSKASTALLNTAHRAAPSLCPTGIPLATSLKHETSTKAGCRSTHFTAAKLTRKAPLSQACSDLLITVPKTASLPRLRDALTSHWYAARMRQPGSTEPRVSSPLRPAPSEDRPESGDAENEAALLRAFDVPGANAYELLSYEEEEEDEEEDEEEEDENQEENEENSSGEAVESDDESAGDQEEFRIGVRVAAVRRTEGNRRAGGLKTQKAMEFLGIARDTTQIMDDIVDEHALLLFIKYNAEREKRTRKGASIPGTHLSASQLKKLAGCYPDLARDRPATTVIVFDAIKTRMDEALERVRNGLDDGEDAPDIIANTFLAEGFLAHRHIRLAVFGHLAWTAQHASGNRGDDFRALKLCELQPFNITHPNGRTAIYSVLGLQGEEKAGKRGMRTVVNPVYSAFIAHMEPEMCPLGALAFYFHYLYDVKKLPSIMNIDWALNKSWRQVRLLHGPKAETVPFNEQSLYNLYCRASQAAGFNSRLKAHLPRHLLGYKQAEMNVDATEKSKMGWKGDIDVYRVLIRLLILSQAILGAAGFRADEPYDPVWRHVRVPERFLSLVCTMAEEIQASIVGTSVSLRFHSH
ncbi:hypothetical protein B0H17DRAFT_1159658 [Mycena rosella]|uniref:Ndc10 domain-containing protein n=1 Tax=Mycena rosella TaxID=1033263 RepID=A0AAD7DIQ4_MYCRO|nr:hypothetical protein B0H17DRAFT_1159658 [Mycena rosella]